MIRTVTILFFLFIALSSSSQNKNAVIGGTVTDENALPAEAVTVALLNAKDSSGVRSAITNTKGEYNFAAVKAGKYLLLYTAVGYKKSYSNLFTITAGQRQAMPFVKLSALPFALSEVVIRDRKNFIDVRADKTVLNVDKNILATGASVLSVLSTAPGVKVNATGDLLMRAGQQAALLVNGKAVKLQGADLTAFLQSLQSSDINQVELIANPSAKYDAAGAGGVINIITKKGANYGFNGTLTATAGYGRFGKGGTAFTGNYRTKKFNLFGSGGFDYNKTFLNITTARNVNDVQRSSFYTDYYNTSKTPKYNFRLGADYFLDSLHTIGFLVYGSIYTARFNKQTNTSLFKNGIADSLLTTLTNLRRFIANPDFNINYQGIIGKHQTLGADADVALYRRRANEDLFSFQRRATAGNAPGNIDTLVNTAPTNITNSTLKVDYTNQLTKNNRIDAGLKGSYVHSRNEQFFGELTSNTFIAYPALTSTFKYTERVGAAYINFNHSGKLLTYNAGLRFEDFWSDANLASGNNRVQRSYKNFFPALQIVYKPNNSEWIFDYNRRVDYLDYSTVNPIVAYQDIYNFTAGNPTLQPAYINNIQLAYGYKSLFKIAFASTHTTNLFRFSYFAQNDATKVLLVTRLNLRSATSNGFIIDVPGSIGTRYNFNFHSELLYQHYKDYEGLLNKGNKDLIFALDQNFNIGKTLTATVNGHYESSTFYGVSSLKPNYFLSAGLSKQFGKSSTLTFSVSDIFNTDRDRYRTMFANVNITATYQKRETQVFRLSYTYRFGKRSVKAARKHTAGNIEEQRRISN